MFWVAFFILGHAKELFHRGAKNSTKRYCAYQERCHKEVKNKLQQLGAYGDTSNAVISHLIQHDYLNETRFAVHYVRGKFSIKKWGKKEL